MARCPPQVTVFQHSMQQQSNRKASSELNSCK